MARIPALDPRTAARRAARLAAAAATRRHALALTRRVRQCEAHRNLAVGLFGARVVVVLGMNFRHVDFQVSLIGKGYESLLNTGCFFAHEMILPEVVLEIRIRGIILILHPSTLAQEARVMLAAKVLKELNVVEEVRLAEGTARVCLLEVGAHVSRRVHFLFLEKDLEMFEAKLAH